MEWKAVCSYCSKSIDSPRDALFMFSLKGDEFVHVLCYAEKLKAYAKDATIAGVAAAVTGQGVASIAASNTVRKNIELAEKGNRKDLQNSITSTSNFQIGFGILGMALLAFVLLNLDKLKFDFIVWVAVLIFCLLGIAALYVSITYRRKLAEFEKLAG